MSNKNVEKIVDSKASFAAKVDPATLITSIQKDLLRVHDYAMTQERSTTFVLADFTLQLKAVVTQEGEKTMFALPTKQGDIDPNTMSILNLTLRPIPVEIKPSASSKRPVEAIEGIGSVIGEKLRAMGIETVSDLAVASTDDVVKADVPRKRASEFVSMAKLMTKSDIAGVDGVDEQVAELLVASRIDSKEKLAQTTPEELTKILGETLQSGKAKVPKTYQVSVDASRRYIDSAKTIVARTRT